MPRTITTKNSLHRFGSSTDGLAVVEYAVTGALVVIAISAGFVMLGTSVGEQLTRLAAAIDQPTAISAAADVAAAASEDDVTEPATGGKPAAPGDGKAAPPASPPGLGKDKPAKPVKP